MWDVGSTGGEPDEEARTDNGMAAAIKRHWLLFFQAVEDGTHEMLDEATAWTQQRNSIGMRTPSESDIARTMCMLLRAFADGTRVPKGLNEAWLAVLPKGNEAADTDEECIRTVDFLRPSLLKNTDRKVVAGALARRMRPILMKEVHPTQRGFFAGRDLVRNAVEVDTFARALHGGAVGRLAGPFAV